MCLLSEVATGWKAGSGFHSALGQLATSEFICKKSLLFELMGYVVVQLGLFNSVGTV